MLCLGAANSPAFTSRKSFGVGLPKYELSKSGASAWFVHRHPGLRGQRYTGGSGGSRRVNSWNKDGCGGDRISRGTHGASSQGSQFTAITTTTLDPRVDPVTAAVSFNSVTNATLSAGEQPCWRPLVMAIVVRQTGLEGFSRIRWGRDP